MVVRGNLIGSVIHPKQLAHQLLDGDNTMVDEDLILLLLASLSRSYKPGACYLYGK